MSARVRIRAARVARYAGAACAERGASPDLGGTPDSDGRAEQAKALAAGHVSAAANRELAPPVGRLPGEREVAATEIADGGPVRRFRGIGARFGGGVPRLRRKRTAGRAEAASESGSAPAAVWAPEPGPTGSVYGGVVRPARVDGDDSAGGRGPTRSRDSYGMGRARASRICETAGEGAPREMAHGFGRGR